VADNALNGCDELTRGTVRGTVAAEFQDAGMRVDAFAEESSLCRDTCVACKDHAKRAVLKKKCDRIIVDRMLSVDKRQRGAIGALRFNAYLDFKIKR
jgi:hypothetical protein